MTWGDLPFINYTQFCHTKFLGTELLSLSSQYRGVKSELTFQNCLNMSILHCDFLFVDFEREISAPIVTISALHPHVPKISRKRLFSSKEMFFFYFFSLHRASRETLDMRIPSPLFRIGKCFESKYFTHFTMEIFL